MKYIKTTVIGKVTTIEEYEGTPQEITELIDLSCGECKLNKSEIADSVVAKIHESEIINPLR